jgi:hypothetical protein
MLLAALPVTLSLALLAPVVPLFLLPAIVGGGFGSPLQPIFWCSAWGVGVAATAALWKLLTRDAEGVELPRSNRPAYALVLGVIFAAALLATTFKNTWQWSYILGAPMAVAVVYLARFARARMST